MELCSCWAYFVSFLKSLDTTPDRECHPTVYSWAEGLAVLWCTEASAIVYPLVEGAKANGIEPFPHLQYVLLQLPYFGENHSTRNWNRSCPGLPISKRNSPSRILNEHLSRLSGRLRIGSLPGLYTGGYWALTFKLVGAHSLHKIPLIWGGMKNDSISFWNCVVIL